jgi:hypothetical protein
MRKLVLIGVAALAFAGSFAATAVAGKGVKTKVTLENTELGVYEGVVSSKKDACVENRRLSVWHDTNGNGEVDGDPPDFEIGAAETNDIGEYRVIGNQAPAGDNIIVVVKKAKRGGFKCRGATEVAKAK